jgi:cation:H+ antiporter
MSPRFSVVQFIIGLVILYFGAEALLKGAVRIARAFGISPFLIGMTLVGFGTSAPELTVNLSAAFKESTDIALGNVVGSNISNIGLILGVAAIIRPLTVQMRLLRIEVPIVIAVSLAMWGMTADGLITRLDGVILLAGFLALAIFIYRNSRREPPAVQDELSTLAPNNHGTGWNVALVILGMLGLVGGAELMVRAAVELAKSLGISELIIGLTIVAIGTSLPELASSVVASWRGEADIAVGNVVGSNIFNILLILGATATVQPMPAEPKMARVLIPVMLAFTVALVPIMLRGLQIGRAEGVVLLLAFAGFLAWQTWGALQTAQVPVAG